MSYVELEADRVNVGGFTLAYSTGSGLVLGDPMVTSWTTLEGPGLRVEGGLRVYEEARFDSTIRTQDLIIGPDPAPGQDQPEYQPFSLIERLKEMKQQNEDLTQRVAKLEAAIRR